jgi:hypothetical protein
MQSIDVRVDVSIVVLDGVKTRSECKRSSLQDLCVCITSHALLRLGGVVRCRLTLLSPPRICIAVRPSHYVCVL